MLRELLRLNAVSAVEMPPDFMPMTPDGVVGEMNVAIEGEWMGHPAGPFTMDADKMQQCVDRFEQQANPMMVDYEHYSIGGGDGRAAGWIHSLSVKKGEGGSELWAMVEWTKRACDMIAAGEYRYCSPVIDFGAKDRATGEHVPVELFNVALTNNPFLDGMHPIQLSRVAAAFPPPAKPEDDEEPEAEGASPEAASTEAEGSSGDEGEDAAEGEGESEGEGDASESLEDVAANAPDPAASQPEGVSAEAALSAFVDSVCTASGGSKAAVLDALNALSDEVGGLVRTRLDTTDGSASDAQQIPMTAAPTATENDMADEQNSNATAPAPVADATSVALKAIAEQQAVLLNAFNELKAERAEEKKIAASREAKQLEEGNAARIDAMMADGRLAEHERVAASKLLGSNSDLFESIYGARKAGSASPVGRSQDTGAPARIAASRPTGGTEMTDEEHEAQLARLSAPERKAYDALIAMRKDPKATLRRMLSNQAREGVRVTASRVGIQIPE